MDRGTLDGIELPFQLDQNDATTITFHRDYRNTAEKRTSGCTSRFENRRGRIDDRRPSMKQLVCIVAHSEDGGLASLQSERPDRPRENRQMPAMERFSTLITDDPRLFEVLVQKHQRVVEKYLFKLTPDAGLTRTYVKAADRLLAIPCVYSLALLVEPRLEP